MAGTTGGRLGRHKHSPETITGERDGFGILVKPFGADELKRMVRGLAVSG